MRIAITGATGFIGRHVLAALQTVDEAALHGEPLEIIATTRGGGGEPAPLSRVRWVPLDLQSPPDDPLRYLSFPDVLVHRAWFDIFYEHVNYFRLTDIERMFGEVPPGRCICVMNSNYLGEICDMTNDRYTYEAIEDV